MCQDAIVVRVPQVSTNPGRIRAEGGSQEAVSVPYNQIPEPKEEHHVQTEEYFGRLSRFGDDRRHHCLLVADWPNRATAMPRPVPTPVWPKRPPARRRLRRPRRFRPSTRLPKSDEAAPAAEPAAGGKRPNILFIMGDDIGWMQPSCYHRGLMVGETPHIDRLAKEGAMFMHYYAESSCTAGRCAFFTGMHPFRAGMVLPQLPGAISYLRPGTPGTSQVPAGPRLHHRRVRQEPSGRSSGFIADGARVPGVLGLPLPPGRDAAGQLSGHQQQPDHAGRRAAHEDDPDSRHSGTRGRD